VSQPTQSFGCIATRALAVLVAALCLGFVSKPAAAQCAGTWLASPSEQPGVSGGAVLAHAELPNGDIVVGGDFTSAGGVVANRIARWDGTRWRALGSGMNGSVRALAVLPDGDLVAGGTFTSAGGVSAPSRVARWNGSTWIPYSSANIGPVTSVDAIAVLPTGGFVIGGAFSGVYRNIARWSGSSWLGYASGSLTAVTTLVVRTNPGNAVGYDLIADGNFFGEGRKLSWWNGANWLAVNADPTWNVSALAVRPNGRILALSSSLLRVFETSCFGCLDLTNLTWTQYPAIIGASSLSSMALRTDGTLFVSGNFAVAESQQIAFWNGGSWSGIGTGVVGTASKLTATPSGGMLVGGIFDRVGGTIAARNVARTDGASWSAFNAGFNAPPISGAVLPDGSLAIGGSFTAIGALPANRVVRWDGSAFSALGSGMDGSVSTIASVPGGVVAGGSFTTAGGVAASQIARWNGSAWLPMGSGMNSGVFAATGLFPSGDIVAGGSFTTAGGVSASRIARWNGSAWLPLGSGMDASVWAVTQLPNGDIVAGGEFTTAGGAKCRRVARWNGSAWSPLGSGLDSTVYALLALPNGRLVAGCSRFTPTGATAITVMLWDGSSWSTFGTGTAGDARSLAFTANPASPLGYDIFVGGSFLTADGVSTGVVARWNGTAWSSIGADGGGSVTGIVPLESGEFVFLGSILGGGGVPAGFMARYSLTGVPWVTRRPVEQVVSSGATLTLSATCALGYDFNGPVQFEWRRDGAPISNGAGGASRGGGTVSGASGTLTGEGLTATLVLTNAQPSDAGAYAVTFANSCGSADSGEAEIGVEASCTADLNGDGAVSSADLSVLLSRWGLSGAGDLDGSGVVDSADLAALLSSWGACP
jgi:hypothetical protein